MKLNKISILTTIGALSGWSTTLYSFRASLLEQCQAKSYKPYRFQLLKKSQLYIQWIYLKICVNQIPFSFCSLRLNS